MTSSNSNAMQMLTKFESKSSRAKGIAFHPKLPWILVSLHSSTIQWWEIRMGTLIDRFEEHDGPVRGIAFHPSQPLFVSGGDDYKIKVWNYKTRRCLFTLNGHLDYVRTVFFHHEYPWILSASDDQTVRIWNWQSRSCIAILTGHNHYVMCAQFHPKEDLIVSASLDQTVRVWDISGLRKKHSAPTSMTFEDQMARSNAQADLFGNTDAVVKYVLEGHDRGVNWVSFHPTLPLIVSGGDDRLVKLWRMSETKAWEVDTCRGHFNNISACLFHPRQELIISVGEDRTIRAWDLNKRVCVQSFRRENDRFWVITAHPEADVLAAGHDSGLMVFKLERERPAYTIHQNQVLYVNKEKQLQMIDLSKDAEPQTYLSLKKIGSPWLPIRSLSYNVAERAVLLTSPAEGGIYELVTLSREPSGAIEPSQSLRGAGNSAVFVARNRFAVLNKTNQSIEIQDLSNTNVRSFRSPIRVNEIHYGGIGTLLLCGPTAVLLYDVQQRKSIAELSVSGTKYILWSNDNAHMALLGKHTVTIVTRNLEQLTSIHETIRIKSAAWDDSGVLLYTTLNHIKYTLMSGENGIIRTLASPVYLLKVKGRDVYAMDRDAKLQIFAIDPTEYRFKLALSKQNHDEMLKIIKTSNLVGQSIISYLQKKGFPDIALQFVQDPKTRFDLAIECGNLEIAVDMAKEVNLSKCWSTLATEALRQGNHTVVEMAYQRLRQFEKLSFLYLVTGDDEKLQRMGKIAEHRGDYTSQYQNSLFTGDVQERVSMLKQADMYPLAYMTAKSHGLEEECKEILEACGISEEDITLPKFGTALRKPEIVHETFKENLSLKPQTQSFFEKALVDQVDKLHLEEPSGANGYEVEDLLQDETAIKENVGTLEADNEAGGWDIDGDFAVEEHEGVAEIEEEEPVGPGTSEADLWVRNSPVPADHAAAGSFETAMQLLNRQIGAVNFHPLKDRFLEIYQASRTFLPANAGTKPLVNFLRRTLEDQDPRRLLPIVTRDLEWITSGPLQDAYAYFKANKLDEAIGAFRSILHTVLLISVPTVNEMSEVNQLIEICSQYIIGLTIEMHRRQLPKKDDPDLIKRGLELAAYFTQAKLQPAHRQIALQIAMRASYEAKNLATASTFAARFLELTQAGKIADQAKKIKAAGDRNPHDTIEIEYDQFAEFNVCAISFVPIYAGSDAARCPCDGAYFVPEHKGSLCPVCNISAIGSPATGLRLYV